MKKQSWLDWLETCEIKEFERTKPLSRITTMAQQQLAEQLNKLTSAVELLTTNMIKLQKDVACLKRKRKEEEEPPYDQDNDLESTQWDKNRKSMPPKKQANYSPGGSFRKKVEANARKLQQRKNDQLHRTPTSNTKAPKTYTTTPTTESSKITETPTAPNKQYKIPKLSKSSLLQTATAPTPKTPTSAEHRQLTHQPAHDNTPTANLQSETQPTPSTSTFPLPTSIPTEIDLSITSSSDSGSCSGSCSEDSDSEYEPLKSDEIHIPKWGNIKKKDYEMVPEEYRSGYLPCGWRIVLQSFNSKQKKRGEVGPGLVRRQICQLPLWNDPNKKCCYIEGRNRRDIGNHLKMYHRNSSLNEIAKGTFYVDITEEQCKEQWAEWLKVSKKGQKVKSKEIVEEDEVSDQEDQDSNTDKTPNSDMPADQGQNSTIESQQVITNQEPTPTTTTDIRADNRNQIPDTLTDIDDEEPTYDQYKKHLHQINTENYQTTTNSIMEDRQKADTQSNLLNLETESAIDTAMSESTDRLTIAASICSEAPIEATDEENVTLLNRIEEVSEEQLSSDVPTLTSTPTTDIQTSETIAYLLEEQSRLLQEDGDTSDSEDESI